MGYKQVICISIQSLHGNFAGFIMTRAKLGAIWKAANEMNNNNKKKAKHLIVQNTSSVREHRIKVPGTFGHTLTCLKSSKPVCRGKKGPENVIIVTERRAG